MISGKQKPDLAHYQSNHTGNVVLCRKSNAAETGLKYYADIDKQEQHEIQCVGHLSVHKMQYNAVYNVQTNHGYSERQNILRCVIISTQQNSEQHDRMREQNNGSAAAVTKSIFIPCALPFFFVELRQILFQIGSHPYLLILLVSGFFFHLHKFRILSQDP